MARRRRATLRDTMTGETRTVYRDTSEYQILKQEGWLSNEQISHRKEYKQDWTPDYLDDEYFENDWDSIDDDYPTFDEKEELKQKIEDMYSDITQQIDDIPNEKFLKGRIFYDLTDSKQMLLNIVDDMYAESESDDEINAYYKTMMPVISELVIAIKNDSTQEDLETHVSQLASVLQRGSISLDLAKSLGSMGEYNSQWDKYSAKFVNMSRKDEW